MSVNTARNQIPIVDLSPWWYGDSLLRKNVAEELSHAFEVYGFCVAYLGDDTVFHSAGQELRSRALQFFSLTIEAKREWDYGLGYGYGGFVSKGENGAGLTGNFEEKPPDLVESLSIRGLRHLKPHLNATVADIAPLFCQDMADPGRADPCPPSLQPSVISLHSALSELRQGLNDICEAALGLPSGYLNERCKTDDAGLRLAFYPEQTQPPKPGQVRYGAHADSGSITMVMLDPQCPRGLEVWLPDSMNGGSWIDVCDGHPDLDLERSVILNCGATLERWTNGKWKGALHRVMNQKPQRLSIITSALTPRPDVSIGCLPNCYKQDDDSPLPPPMTAKDFLDARVLLQRPGYRPTAEQMKAFKL